MITVEKTPKLTISDEAIERSTRRHNMLMTIIPAAGLIAAIVTTWKWGGEVWELSLMFLMFSLLMIGIEVGVHRYFTHKSFETKPAVRAILAILGSMAGQGPVIYWAANHRLHHNYSDEQNDPHSPQRSLWHAHMGWLFDHQTPNTAYFTGDLLRDPVLFRLNRLYVLWVIIGCTIPTLIGWGLTATWRGALGGFLWGGLVPLFLAQHAMFSINSICHAFGRRPFNTHDESRNNIWLVLPTFGEAWHNNHHAFPSSARTGLRPWQIDPGGGLIEILKLLGLAWNVRIPTKQKIEEKMNTNTIRKGGTNP
jgi:stearoyl-CoA desaturase (Delta-9 desaturase)